MTITTVEWREWSLAHIAHHRVTPQAVEEICLGQPWIVRGRGGLYYAFGRTDEGRLLFIVIKWLGGGVVSIVTARDMTDAERRRFWRR